MAMTYTGKLFRRLAICCGVPYGKPHKVWESHFQVKYMDDYYSFTDFVYCRGNDNKWMTKMYPADDKEYQYWKALKWLEENGYIMRHEGVCHFGTYNTLTCTDTYITLTEKGLAVAPAYLKQKGE